MTDWFVCSPSTNVPHLITFSASRRVYSVTFVKNTFIFQTSASFPTYHKSYTSLYRSHRHFDNFSNRFTSLGNLFTAVQRNGNHRNPTRVTRKLHHEQWQNRLAVNSLEAWRVQSVPDKSRPTGFADSKRFWPPHPIDRKSIKSTIKLPTFAKAYRPCISKNERL